MNSYEISRAQANSLIEFYRQNPVVAVYDLLGVTLDEIQRIIFRSMWFCDYVIVVACRGLGKSFLQALLATLKALLYPGHRVGLLGSSFRQSKVIFREVEALYQQSEIFREATVRPAIKATDMYEMRFRPAGKYSGSSILAIPLGTDGSKIRGQRFFTICVSGDTFIRTGDGLIPIKNIAPSMDTKVGTLKGLYYPSKYIRNPLGPMYKVTTSKGFEIVSTPDHPLYCMVGNKYKFIPTNKLNIKDKMVIKTFSPKNWPVKEYYTCDYIPDLKYKTKLDQSVTTPGFVNEDLALFLGLIVSEGHVTQPSVIQFANKDVEIIETYMPLVRKLFSKTPNIRYIIPPKYGENSGYYDTQLSSVIIRKYLKEIGLDYVLSKEKTVPFSILQSPLPVVCAFLKGLFEGDGCIHRNYKGRNRPTISYTSISLNLVKQLQILLINLGIVSYFRIARRTQKLRNTCYVLSITGEDVYKFMDLIGFISFRKNDKINEFNRDGNFKVKLNDKGYFIDTIKSIDRAEDAVSYDFTIPKHHSFMSNCFVSHNCCDEFCQIPEQIFNLVIRPMAATTHDPMSNVERIKRQKKLIALGLEVEEESNVNKIVMTSSGFFKVNHMWNRMKHYWKKIEAGDNSYAVHQASYTDLSDGFLNKSNIEEARETMPQCLFEMEYCGKMISDSEGFFKASMIELCIANKLDNYFTVKLKGNKDLEYVMSIDPVRICYVNRPSQDKRFFCYYDF
jgi:intein/homing endonuclease